MTKTRLLAKSWRAVGDESPPDWALLVSHLQVVERAANSIIDTVGDILLEQVDLPAEPWREWLALALPLSGRLHDLGKANGAFQDMLNGQLDPMRQPLRHELISALCMLENANLQAWIYTRLGAKTNDDTKCLFNCVLGAVVGHHLKHDPPWEKAARALGGGCGLELTLLLDDPALQQTFDRLDFRKSWSLRRGDLLRRKLHFAQEAQAWARFLQKHDDWRRFAAILKALTMAADVAGSAVLPTGTALEPWIAATLGNRCSRHDLKAIVQQRLGENEPRKFQRAVAESTARITLVEAGCGSGKTAAAYLWAQHHAAGKKLFFCYPTTGTATEGFLGYVHDSAIEAELLHSRAVIDLEDVGRTDDEDREDRLLRINSLAAWGAQAVICTVDTVLALVRNSRRGLYNAPAILSGTFVFDELHAYDDNLFAALAVLMRVMPRAHFLLMSASMPRARKVWLREYFHDLAEVATPCELEELPRYHFEQIEGTEAALQAAQRCVAEGGKVLWIANTVGRAQACFDQAQTAGLPARCYHSRYKYDDRKCVKRAVIDGFNPEKNSRGLLAVTTQVAEMSLDLDADLLISDIAPMPALIQRLGRLNRRVTPEQPGLPRRALFLDLQSPLPYASEQVELARDWIVNLQSRQTPLSQADLAGELHARSPTEIANFDLRSEWLDSGWYALPGPIRDAGPSVSIILPEDAAICRRQHKEIVRRSIPMTFHAQMTDWHALRGNLIAPPGMISYDAERGARWRN